MDSKPLPAVDLCLVLRAARVEVDQLRKSMMDLEMWVSLLLVVDSLRRSSAKRQIESESTDLLSKAPSITSPSTLAQSSPHVCTQST